MDFKKYTTFFSSLLQNFLWGKWTLWRNQQGSEAITDVYKIGRTVFENWAEMDVKSLKGIKGLFPAESIGVIRFYLCPLLSFCFS